MRFGQTLLLCALPLLGSSLGAQMPTEPPVLSGAADSPTAFPRKPKGARAPLRDGFSLAFVDADVRRVVDAVLGSMLNADYNIDPKVTGNITLRTARPVTREELIPLLQTALDSVDAVIVSRGSGYRIVPRSSARLSAPLSSGSSSGGTATPGFAMEVIALKNGSPREIARLLEQFLGKEVVAGTDLARNQVIITGTQEERQAARDMIARFDVDALAGMNYELYRLDNVDAGTVMAELERIFQPPYDIIGSRIRLVPLPRLHGILAIANDRADLNRIEPWIHKLDAGGSGKRKLYSYAVQNGRARDLAASLQLVLGAGGGTASGGSSSSTASATAPLGDTSPEPSQTIAPQTPLPGNSTPILSPTGGSADSPRIVPNDANNSLLIYANGEEYDFIREALDKIDQPSPQVLIEATLAEVTLGKDFSLGVDWSFLSGKSTFDLRTGATSAPAAVFPGFSYGYTSAAAQVVLNTLQSNTNVRVLSTPKLLVLNNQTATLQVGDQVPIVTQQSQSVAAPGAPVVNNIELRDTGVILKVTPRVNESGMVTLDISQEVSDVAETTSSGINSPTIQQRRIASTVSTRSGQMIALGGLIRDRVSNGRSGIPFLSQIPIIGSAFGQQTSKGSKTELIILLTPTVIRSPEEAKAVVDELIDRLDTTKPLVERARQRQVGAPLPPKQ